MLAYCSVEFWMNIFYFPILYFLESEKHLHTLWKKTNLSTRSISCWRTRLGLGEWERSEREHKRQRNIYIYIKIRHARMTNVLRNCREFLSVLLNGLRVAFVWETSHFSYAKINRCEHSQPSIIQSRRIYMEAGLRADGYGKYEKERKTEQLRGENIQVPVHWPLV